MNDRPCAPPVRRGRRFLVSEVVQTSAMDCGPAALKSLLDGFRIPVSYGRLREACHTDVDGTSIDALESLACELGLQAEQVMIPADHVLLGDDAGRAAIAVVAGPLGSAHFVVAWRRHGPVVQVMDPARGRLWLPVRSFRKTLFAHSAIVPADEWRTWAGSDAFLKPLRLRLCHIGAASSAADRLLARAVEDPSWETMATLDASVRFITSLSDSRAVDRPTALRLLDQLLAEGLGRSGAPRIPDRYWSAQQAPAGKGSAGQLQLRGAVLVRVTGATTSADRGAEPAVAFSPHRPSPAVAAAIDEKPAQPIREAIRSLRADGLLGPGVVAAALIIAVAGVLLEAVLLRSLLDVGLYLRTTEQGLAAGAAVAAFAVLMLALEFGLGSAEQRAGRVLEARLRMAFLDKVPRLPDAYFQTRAVSDMAERSHGVHLLRTLPALGVRLLRVSLELVVTTAAIAWLAPDAAWLALAAAAAAVGIPFAGRTVLAERDLRVRTHAGALGRFHLDALLGRTAIEAHGGGGAMQHEHEGLLREWVTAALSFQRGSVAIEGLQMLIGFGLVGWMIFGHATGSEIGGTLLLAYWVLNLPVLGYELALDAREYPAHRNVLLRLLEPLGASSSLEPSDRPAVPVEPASTPVRIEARDVSVSVAGRAVLEHLDFVIEPGSHMAIVGASGAGKSTLAGLLLGWHRVAAGELLFDGRVATPEHADALRQDTAWVDPDVRLWNDTLLENLRYGSDPQAPVAPVLEAAGLVSVLAKLPDGLATPLGEGGGLLSAGEAQRVRLGRAMLKAHPRLVILDEPFMGLERDRRRALLQEVRQRWAGSTLLYVTHEMTEARAFDRVLVVERGRVVEDGDPRMLAQMASSRYRRLLQAQEAVHARMTTGSEWRRLRVQDGRIVQDLANATIEQTA